MIRAPSTYHHLISLCHNPTRVVSCRSNTTSTNSISSAPCGLHRLLCCWCCCPVWRCGPTQRQVGRSVFTEHTGCMESVWRVFWHTFTYLKASSTLFQWVDCSHACVSPVAPCVSLVHFVPILPVIPSCPLSVHTHQPLNVHTNTTACTHTKTGSRVAPDDSLLLSTDTTTSPASHASTTPPPVPQDSSLHKKHKKHKNSSSIDYQDQDPDVRSHWALLAAGSSGWFNYRHQADVYHAYQVGIRFSVVCLSR